MASRDFINRDNFATCLKKRFRIENVLRALLIVGFADHFAHLEIAVLDSLGQVNDAPQGKRDREQSRKNLPAGGFDFLG